MNFGAVWENLKTGEGIRDTRSGSSYSAICASLSEHLQSVFNSQISLLLGGLLCPLFHFSESLVQLSFLIPQNLPINCYVPDTTPGKNDKAQGVLIPVHFLCQLKKEKAGNPKLNSWEQRNLKQGRQLWTESGILLGGGEEAQTHCRHTEKKISKAEKRL